LACCAAIAVGAFGTVGSGSAALGVHPGIAYDTSTPKGAGESVWLANGSGGGAHKLGPGATPILSPDGDMVAAETFGSHGAALVIYSSSGGVVGKFFNVVKTTAQTLEWSADSRFLLVALFDTTHFKTVGQSAVAVIDTSDNKITTIAHGWVSGGSFSPTAPYSVVYGLSSSQDFKANVNLFRAPVSGSGSPMQITHDGRSLNPVWGANGLAFDHETLRGNNAPAFQIMLMQGSHTTQITHTKPNKFVVGLVPQAVSADGDHLLASYQGQDTDSGWTVDLATHATHELTVHGRVVVADGISLDGKSVLVDLGDFENPPAAGTVYSVPWSGGSPTLLLHKAGQPSWNR
jgi:hypothetical protein